MVLGLNLLSAFFAVLAAVAWIRSTVVRGYPTDKPEPRPPGPSYPTPQIGFGLDKEGHQYGLFATIRLQSKWNSYAARLAAAAAVCQAAAVILSVRFQAP